MQLVLLSFLLHIGAIFSSAVSIKENVGDAFRNICPKCFEVIDTFNLTYPFWGERRWTRYKIFIIKTTDSVYYHPECRDNMYRCLASSQNDATTKILQDKMFGIMAEFSRKEFFDMLNSMDLTLRESKCLVKNVAKFHFEDLEKNVKEYIASVTTTYQITDFNKYLTSKDNGYIPPEVYNIALAKCFANGLSESQMLAILDSFLQRCRIYGEDWRSAVSENFTDAIALSPHIQISPSNVGQIMMAGLVKNELVSEDLLFLAKAKIEGTTDIKKILETFRWCFNIYKSDNEYAYAYIWHCATCLYKSGKSGTEFILQIEQVAGDYLAEMDESECSVVKEWIKMLCFQLADEKPLEISEAKEKMLEVDNIYCRNSMREASILKKIAKNGIIRTIIRADEETCERLCRGMFYRWRFFISTNVYLGIPESNACAERDLLFLYELLRRYKPWKRQYIIQNITTITQREYFDYEMLMKALDIILEVELCTDIFNLMSTWLLLAADCRCFFEKLSSEKLTALFEKLARAKLFIGIALLEKHFGGQEECKSITKAAANDILLAYISLPSILQEYIACHYTSNYVFTIWSRNITSAMELLFEDRHGKGSCNISHSNHFMMNMCGSEYFVKNVGDAEVRELVQTLIDLSSPVSMGCIGLFLTVTHEHPQETIAKAVLLKKFVALGPTGDDFIAMNAIGIKLELVDSTFAYRADDNSMVVVDLDNISENLAEIIRAIDGHCLLKLLQDMLTRELGA